MSQQNVELVRKLLERWERGDLATADAFYPQVEFIQSGAEGVHLSGQWRGIDELWGVVRDIVRMLDDYRIVGEEFIDLGDERVFVLARDRAIGRASGAPIEHETAFVFTLRDGLIVRWEAYWNRDEGRKAAGLAE
jgi:ketosteroid isomerase-like protein